MSEQDYTKAELDRLVLLTPDERGCCSHGAEIQRLQRQLDQEKRWFQEKHNQVERLRKSLAESRRQLTEAQAERDKLCGRLVDALADFDSLTELHEATEASLAARTEHDATWTAIQNAFDIEPREFFEAEAPKNGFVYPLCQAVHHMWKRDPKVAALTKERLVNEMEGEASKNRLKAIRFGDNGMIEDEAIANAIADTWESCARILASPTSAPVDRITERVKANRHTPFDYDGLDPGIREAVRTLREAGFRTSDSGDGTSKSSDQRVLDVPHVAGVLDRSDDCYWFAEADRAMRLLGRDWHIEVSYCPNDQSRILLATYGPGFASPTSPTPGTKE